MIDVQIDKLDESTIKLITEIVIKVLKEMNVPIDPAKAECRMETAKACPAAVSECSFHDKDPVIIPGRGIGRDLITEREVLQLIANNQASLVCKKDTIITSLAADRLKSAGIQVIRQ